MVSGWDVGGLIYPLLAGFSRDNKGADVVGSGWGLYSRISYYEPTSTQRL